MSHRTSAQVAQDLARRLNIEFDTALILARAEKILNRWNTLECGDGNNHASWSIERDETTQRPYIVTHPHQGKSFRRAIADREQGAIKRVTKTCADAGLHFYYQSDPRGCSLYVSREPIGEADYTNGVAVC